MALHSSATAVVSDRRTATCGQVKAPSQTAPWKRKSRAKLGPRKKRIYVPHRSIVVGEVTAETLIADRLILHQYGHLLSNDVGDGVELVDINDSTSSPPTTEQLFEGYYDALVAVKTVITVRGAWFVMPDLTQKSSPAAACKLSVRQFVHASLGSSLRSCSCGGFATSCCHLWALAVHENTLATANNRSGNCLNIRYDTQAEPVVLLYHQQHPRRRVLSVLDGVDARKMPSLVTQQPVKVARDRRPSATVDYGMRCSSCNTEQTCRHIIAAVEFVQPIDDDCSPLTDTPTPTGDDNNDADCVDFVRSVSQEVIPLPAALAIDENVSISAPSPTESTLVSDVCDRIRFGDRITLAPKVCKQHGSAPLTQLELVASESHPSMLYGMSAAMRVTVHRGRCSVDDHWIEYDGVDDGVYHYNNNLLFTHEVINDYTIQYSSSETPFHAYVRGVRERYVSNARARGIPLADVTQFISRPTFQKVWFSYIQLQQWQYRFQCPTCMETPQVIICDGITLQCPKTASDTFYPPTYTDHQSMRTTAATSDFDVRDCYVADHKLAAAIGAELNRWLAAVVTARQQAMVRSKDDVVVASMRSVQLSGAVIEAISLIEFDANLIDRLRLVAAPLADFIEFFVNHVRYLAATVDDIDFTTGFKQIGKRLIEVLLSRDAIISVARYPTPKLVEWLMVNPSKIGEPEVCRVFGALSPVLFAIFDWYWQQNLHSRSPPPAVTKLISDVCRRASDIDRRMCDFERARNRLPGDTATLSAASSGPEEHDAATFMRTKCYYNRPVLRRRPIYDVDSQRSRAHRDDPNVVNKQSRCSKLVVRHRAATNGIMIFWCRHRVALGFHILPDSEGRNDIFSAIITRWRVAPKVIVYDFACDLAAYCLRREYLFFRETLFVIDQFHAYNHTCSEVYKIVTYKNTNASIRFLNCSAAEQGNAGLQKTRKSTYRMLPTNLMLFVRLQLEVHNRRVMKQLQANRYSPAQNISQEYVTHVDALVSGSNVDEFRPVDHRLRCPISIR